MPSSNTRRPLPPASTTPASANTGSRVGVRSRLCVASSTVASRTATTSPAAEDLAQEAAGVPAGPHERPASHGGHYRPGALLPAALRLLHHRAHGEEHVGAGIA